MIASSKILNTAVTCNHTYGNRPPKTNHQGFKMNTGVKPKLQGFSSSNFTKSNNQCQKLKVSSVPGHVIQKRASFTKVRSWSFENGYPHEKIPFESLKYFSNEGSPIENQNAVISSGTRYWIQNSKLAENMLCKQSSSGAISCQIPGDTQKIVFEVDNFSDNEILDDHMSEVFGERCVFELSGDPLDICQSSLEVALYDYDKFTLASHLLSKSGVEFLDQILEWIPEYAGQLAQVQLNKKSKLEDSFDIE